MAFVFRAEKKDLPSTKEKIPGPGNYITHQPYQFEQNRVPFASTEKQQLKPKVEDNPGPGAYNIAKGFLAPERSPNVFFVPVNPDGETDPMKATNVFKSKAKRFEHKTDNEIPGPGAYSQKSNFGNKNKNPALTMKNNRLEQVQELLRLGKNAVPSIPSNVHSYGYTENDDHELVLNKNPLIQVQQFVGPGYYEAKPTPQNLKYKGPSWHKSGVKKGAPITHGTATSNTVGPGTYDPEYASNPAYKTNPHSGFISTSTRSFDAHVKQKLGFAGRFQSRTPGSSQSTFERRAASHAETRDDEEEEEEYVKDATPGPGHYHNDSLMSSFSLRTPSSDQTLNGSKRFGKGKPPAFGTSVRFKEVVPTTNDLGPGTYDSNPKTKKLDIKYAKVPFLSSNIRFERENVVLNPGPGTYDPPVNIVHRVQEKGKSGYNGSFGVTDKRFKVSKLLEDLPGPGSYTVEDDTGKDAAAIFKKGSHFFTSESQRGVFAQKSSSNAGPGSYDLNYQTIAKKTAKEEDDFDLPKRYPFNTGQARFEKPKEKPIPEDEDEDEDDEPRFGTSKNLESLLKSKIKQKPNASFLSKTKRGIGGIQNNVHPGPGAYHDQNQNLWNKRTFNIHFTGD